MTSPAQPSPPTNPISPTSPNTASCQPFGTIRLSNAHQEGLYNLFTGYASQSPPPRGEKLLQQIREDLEPGELVHPMITVNYEMHKKIRFFLNDSGIDTPSTGASGGMIVNRLLHAIRDRPDDTDERNKAIQQFKDIKSGIYVPLSPSSSNSGSQKAPFATQQSPIALTTRHYLRPDQAGFASKAMSTGYSSEYPRFHGKIDEDWPTKLSRYQFLCAQNKMTSADKISHMHYMLDGSALQFFINEIEGRVTNYGDLIRRFNERYASAAKQDYMSQRLQEIRMSRFETGSNVTELQAFRDTIDEINRLTPMAHPEDRTDRAKMLHLQNAVTGREWARTVLSTVAANDLKYHTLIERLEYSLQQTAKHQQAALGSYDGYASQLRSSRWNATNFAGQARYAREPRSRASIVPRYARHDRRFHPHQKDSWPQPQTTRSPPLCHNCNRPACRWYKCTEPLDMKKVIQNRLRASKKTGQVRASSRANTTNVVEELAQDINELVETLIISSDAELCEDTDVGLNEELMVQLEQEADAHASVTYDASFEFSHHSETEAYPDGDLGASESFFHGA